MSKIAIVTDSNSGITQEEGRRLGVSVIPMPFFINEKMYLEGITLSQDEFYQWLKSDASISTSQPSPGCRHMPERCQRRRRGPACRRNMPP